MSTPSPAPDPTAATDVPRERARLPPAPAQVGGREWFRRGERQGQPDEFDLLSAEELPEERLLRQAEATVEDEPTDPGEAPAAPAPAPVAPEPVERWVDPYLSLSLPERSVAYLAHMCEIMELRERRLRQQEQRDSVMDEALDEAQAHYKGRKRDLLAHKGRTLASTLAESRGANNRQAAAVGGAVAVAVGMAGLIAEFVLDHLDVILSLVRGL